MGIRQDASAPSKPQDKKVRALVLDVEDYGHEKKSKIQHFCARKLLKTLGRFLQNQFFLMTYAALGDPPAEPKPNRIVA